MRDFKYQLNKIKKPVTNFATKILKCYHNFLDVFSKKNLDKVMPHFKYDYKIELLIGGKNYKQVALCDMSKLQLKFVKQFLEKHLKKSFIKANKASCSLPILLARKLKDGIRFCVDCRKLNKLTKKNTYLILLIAKILAQLKNIKVFIKIDI